MSKVKKPTDYLPPWENRQNYFDFNDSVVSYWERSRPSPPGIYTERGLKRLKQIRLCRQRLPVEQRRTPVDGKIRRDCRHCIICRYHHAKKKAKQLRDAVLNPKSYPHYSVALSLPHLREPWLKKGQEVPTAIRYLFALLGINHEYIWTDGTARDVSSAQGVTELRKAARKSLEACFPGYRLGMLCFTHLTDDYLNYRPHFHVVLCDALVESRDVDITPDQIKSIGNVCKLDTFKANLAGHWARELSKAISSYAATVVGSPAVQQGTQELLDPMLLKLRQRVKPPDKLLSFAHRIERMAAKDSNLAYVKRIGGQANPIEMDLENVLDYDASGEFKRIMFAKEGSKFRLWCNRQKARAKPRDFVQLTPLKRIFRGMMQTMSFKGWKLVRLGYYNRSGNVPKGLPQAFLDTMNALANVK